MKPLRTLAWVEMKLFLREPLALVFAFAFPFFMLFVLLGVFGNEREVTDPEEAAIWRNVGPADYYVSTYVGLVMSAAGVITLPLRLAGYREAGVLRRYRAAGVPLGVVLGSQVAVAMGMAMVAAAGIVVVSTALYDSVLPENWPLVLAGVAIGLATFACIGIFLGAVLPTARAVQGAGLAIFFVMMMVSGSGPPDGALTSQMRSFAATLPLTHVNHLVQDAWLGHGWSLGHALVALAFAALTALLALRWFRWE